MEKPPTFTQKWECGLCTWSEFFSPGEWAEHLQNTHLKEIFENGNCPICATKFDSPAFAVKHIYNNHRRICFKCTICMVSHLHMCTVNEHICERCGHCEELLLREHLKFVKLMKVIKFIVNCPVNNLKYIA